MKKIYTVLVAVGSFTFANAQSHFEKNDSRNNNYLARNDDRRFDNAYAFTARERDEQIAKINSVYASKVRAVNMDRFLKANKKRKEIAKIEVERSQKIREINAKFADRRNRYNDTYAYGSYNGKH